MSPETLDWDPMGETSPVIRPRWNPRDSRGRHREGRPPPRPKPGSCCVPSSLDNDCTQGPDYTHPRAEKLDGLCAAHTSSFSSSHRPPRLWGVSIPDCSRQTKDVEDQGRTHPLSSLYGVDGQCPVPALVSSTTLLPRLRDETSGPPDREIPKSRSVK